MPSPPPAVSRRQAIAALSVSALSGSAGCLESLDPRSSCADETTVSLQAVGHPAHVSNEFCTVRGSLPYGTRELVATAMEAGEATVRDYYAPALRKRYVVSGPEKRFFRVRTTDRDPAAVTGYEYAVEVEDVDGSADDESVHSFEDLPAADREAIHRALGNASLLDAPHYTSFSTVFAFDDPYVREASAFVPETDGVSVEWSGFLLRFLFESERSVTLTTTTVSTEQVADSADAFSEHVFDARGLVLGPLPSEQREIVADAIDSGSHECGSRSDPFAALLDRLVTDAGEFAPLVEYEGTRYFTHVSVTPDELR